MPTRGVYSVAIPVIGKRGWGRFSKGGGEGFQKGVGKFFKILAEYTPLMHTST